MEVSMWITLIIYCLSLACNLATAVISFILFKRSIISLGWAWLIISLGLSLMSVKMAGSLFKLIQEGHFDLMDAILSLPVSVCLLVGSIGLKNILLKADNKYLLLETLAQFDPLTNSYSRSQILYRISEEIDRSLRTHRPFSLLEFDIDHFKYVNDQFGHQIGDEVLIDLVRHTKEVLRTVDSVGRIGGEEFLLLMPETDSQGAYKIAERLRAHIESATNQTKAPTPIKISISIGVATFQLSNSLQIERSILLNELIRQADMAMYEAKNNGRNQVAIYRESQ